MPKYEVRIQVTGEATFVVEAKDMEEAEEKAREQADACLKQDRVLPCGFEQEWVELDDTADVTEVA